MKEADETEHRPHEKGIMDTKFRSYHVVKGVKDLGVGCVAVSPLACIRLGVAEKDDMVVQIGYRLFRLASRSSLQDDVICIMAWDRKILGVELGESIALTGGSARGTGTRDQLPLKEVATLIVRRGEKDDSDDPPTAMISGKLMKELGLQVDTPVAVSGTAGGQRVHARIRIGARLTADDDVGLRKKLRDVLGVELGGDVILWVQRRERGRRDEEQQEAGDARITIASRSIVAMAVDAVVNAANERLRCGGGVDGAIHEAAGPRLRRACRKFRGCEVGQVKATKGFDLPARYILHTVGPQWETGTHNEHRLLAKCYRNTLALAVKKDVHVIAFPCISVGVYGFPIEDASVIALREIGAFLADNDLPKKVFLCLHTEEEKAIYQRLLAWSRARRDIEYAFFIHQAKKDTPNGEISLTRRGAKKLGADDGDKVTARSVSGKTVCRVAVEKTEYPIHRCRLNADTRKRLGVERGDLLQLSMVSRRQDEEATGNQGVGNEERTSDV